MGYAPLLRDSLLALLIEALLLGCLGTLYPISLWMLVYRHRRRRLQHARMGIWLFAIVTAMVALATAHFILISRAAISALVDNSSIPDGALLFWLSGGEDSAYTTGALLGTCLTAIGDSFMVYRVFVVWGRRWVAIILPISLLLAAIASGITSAFAFARTGLSISEALYTDEVYAAMTSFLAIALAKNVTLLAFLLGRLLWHGRAATKAARELNTNTAMFTTHWEVVRTIVQSEALYSATLVANLAAYLTHSRLLFLTTNALPPLIGISFTLIITHVGFHDIMSQVKEADGARPSSIRWAVVDSDSNRKNDSLLSVRSSAVTLPPSVRMWESSAAAGGVIGPSSSNTCSVYQDGPVRGLVSLETA
ncbi:hypothetical protein C2E23DRAFT_765856 [Lenzites betulinus]|nr:hypothetical protein C2E23DRAFT_765856 [Lenzites betulinus]